MSKDILTDTATLALHSSMSDDIFTNTGTLSSHAVPCPMTLIYRCGYVISMSVHDYMDMRHITNYSYKVIVSMRDFVIIKTQCKICHC